MAPHCEWIVSRAARASAHSARQHPLIIPGVHQRLLRFDDEFGALESRSDEEAVDDAECEAVRLLRAPEQLDAHDVEK